MAPFSRVAVVLGHVGMGQHSGGRMHLFFVARAVPSVGSAVAAMVVWGRGTWADKSAVPARLSAAHERTGVVAGGIGAGWAVESAKAGSCAVGGARTA